MIESWTPEQLEAFERDGFLIVEKGFIDEERIEELRGAFDRLYAGEYESGIRPDEVNWVAGRDPEDRTRQICNGWKADPVIAGQVLAEGTGRLSAELMGWDGVRILQDDIHRRACISHLVPAETRFHPLNVDPTYSRYRRVGDTAMDDSFFPVVWTRDGGRSAWLDAEVAEDAGGVLAESGH
jgi:hypothetical protein